MGKLTEQTIIKTVEEMIHEGCEPDWIREEVECMFERQFTDTEWDTITMQALIRKAFTRPLPEA